MKIEQYGPHKVTNASVENPIVDQLLAGETVRVLYSDPPWGDGNMKYWTTMAKKMAGQVYQPLTYQQLLDRIFELVRRHVDGYVMIESGPRWTEYLVQYFRNAGLFNVQSFMLQYRAGSKILPNPLVVGATKPHYRFDYNPAGQMGAKVAFNCIESVKVPGGIVLDPCCGMGYTAQAAIDNGMVFRGNELNRARLEKTIARLRKAVG